MKCKCEGVVCSLCNGEKRYHNGFIDPDTGQAPLIKCWCDGGLVCDHSYREPIATDHPEAISVCDCCGYYWTGDSSS